MSNLNEIIKEEENYNETIQFYKETLDAHNELRNLHNADILCLNLKLCKIAQDSALKYANSMSITNSNENESNILGENVAFQFSNSEDSVNGVVITRLWYNEIKNFKFSNLVFSPTTGHFTQLIWKGTTDVGFGRAKGKDGSYIMVAKYYPAGNVQNEFERNVENLKN
jgi:hypothetical protein